MANVDNPHGFQYERRTSGNGVPPMVTMQAQTNTAIAAGDPVVVGTDGYLTVASATSAQLFGVAAHAITAATGTYKDVMVIAALPDVVFSGQCSGDAQRTRIGEQVDIEGSTGIFEINEDASSIDVLQIVGLKPGSAWGTNAELLFIIRESQYAGTT